MMKVFIVIPVYNEDKFILTKVIENLLPLAYTIVIIDDGSVTNVKNILPPLPVHILTHAVNLGQGAALQTGFAFAISHNADVIISFDADGQHFAGDIEHLLLPVFNNETDVVLGSRFLPGNKEKIPLIKKIILHLARFINFIFTGLLLSDAHNGLRVFNKKAIAAIHLTENRMAHASEILFEIKKNKLRYKELPVQIHYSNYATKKGQSAAAGIQVLFDLVLHKFFK